LSTGRAPSRFDHPPIATLTSKPYAARRRAELKPEQANPRPTPGDPAQADTIYLTVVDRDFNQKENDLSRSRKKTISCMG
jgi:gamma-glutamyltranspeptidase / glutathione hydrolase